MDALGRRDMADHNAMDYELPYVDVRLDDRVLSYRHCARTAEVPDDMPFDDKLVVCVHGTRHMGLWRNSVRRTQGGRLSRSC